MLISNSPSLAAPSRTPKSAPAAETPPAGDGFQSSPPAQPSLLTKTGRAAVQGGMAGTGLMIATAASTALRGSLGGVLGPLVATGIGAIAGGVVATQRAKHRGIAQADSTQSVLTGVAAGAALGAASAFPGLMLPAWGLGTAAGLASEFF